MQHNQSKFSDIHLLHRTDATTTTTTAIKSQPPLSPPPLSQTLQLTKASFSHLSKSFPFTSSTLSFWGMSRTKASFSHLPLSVFPGNFSRKRLSHLLLSVPTTYQGKIWYLPCLACLLACLPACLLLILDKQPLGKPIFQRPMGQHHVTFWLSFCYRSVSRFEEYIIVFQAPTPSKDKPHTAKCGPQLLDWKNASAFRSAVCEVTFRQPRASSSDDETWLRRMQPGAAPAAASRFSSQVEYFCHSLGCTGQCFRIHSKR